MERAAVTRQINFETGTPFGLWMRKQNEIDSRRCGLSIQNLDYVIHRYSFPSCEAVMLVEEKTHSGKQSYAQRSTHGLIDQALRLADRKMVKTSRGQMKELRYCGYHILTFENTTPDNGRMWWDGQLIDRELLLKVLRFAVNPSKPFEEAKKAA